MIQTHAMRLSSLIYAVRMHVDRKSPIPAQLLEAGRRRDVEWLLIAFMGLSRLDPDKQFRIRQSYQSVLTDLPDL